MPCTAGAARASAPELEWLALKDKAVRKRAGDLLWPAKILVIAFALTGKERMDGVMKIVTPDCVQSIAAGFARADDLGIVLIGFSNHANVAAEFSGQRSDIGFDFGQNMPRRIVLDGLHRVQAKAVHVVFAHPVKSVFSKISADAFAAGLIEVDGFAPWRLMFVGEVGTKEPQIIAFIAKMVVNHIKHHGQADCMRGIDQPLETFRAAITGLHCVGRYTVITPVARAGKSCDRHDLNHGDAKFFQVRQLGDSRVECAFRRERADVEFVNHVVAQRKAAPG